MTKYLLCVILLIALLIGCAPTIVEAPHEIEGAPPYVERFIDEEAGVVCWIVRYRGITCLPICCTDLGGSDCDEW